MLTISAVLRTVTCRIGTGFESFSGGFMVALKGGAGIRKVFFESYRFSDGV